MNIKLLVVAVAAVVTMTGCSSMNGGGSVGVKPSSDATTPIKDAKISTEFTDEGIKIFYTMTGKLEKIEVYGVAPAWKRNHDILANDDAMEKLLKFVHGQTVSSERRVKIISKALDVASDSTSNKFRSEDGTIQTDSKSLESAGNNESTQNDNVAKRNAQIADETNINLVRTVTSKGFLGGVRKIGDAVKQDGKLYVAIYQWSPRDQGVAIDIRNQMLKGQ
jgi:hypothetical protein